MLSFFPTPYYDELLYSLIARYHERSGNYLIRDTIYQLFGDKTQCSSTVIPMRLGFMAKQTLKYGLDLKALLNNHTIYPFLTTFASVKNVETVYQKLENNEKGAFYADLGLFNYIAKPKYLRFCPLCYQEEMNLYGEAYWHRFHQTPGLMLCEKHCISLCDSIAPYESKHDRNYITINTVVKDVRKFNCSLIQNNALFSILTRSVMFIYKQNDMIRKIFELYDYSFAALFQKLLKEKGYATQNGSIRTKKLIAGFQDFFGNEKLECLGYEVNKQKRPWPITLCRNSKSTWDPIKFILMGSFLCDSFENFIDVANHNLHKLQQKQGLIYNQCSDYEKLEIYHGRWINARKRAPKDTRNSIIEQDHAAYTWLLRHDKQWLIENSPLPQKRGGNKSFSNWIERDKSYSCRIPDIAQGLFKKVDAKPVWVSKTKLLKQLGINSTVLSNGRLAKTKKALSEWSETQDHFRLRKIAWAVTECKKEGLSIVNWRILRRAGVRDDLWKNYYPVVQSLALLNEYSASN